MASMLAFCAASMSMSWRNVVSVTLGSGSAGGAAAAPSAQQRGKRVHRVQLLVSVPVQ